MARRRRYAVSESELALFLRQYGRKAPHRGEPNDRSYSRDIERRVKRMSPEDLSHLMHNDAEETLDG